MKRITKKTKRERERRNESDHDHEPHKKIQWQHLRTVKKNLNKTNLTA
jgi:hypothetical protein